MPIVVNNDPALNPTLNMVVDEKFVHSLCHTRHHLFYNEQSDRFTLIHGDDPASLNLNSSMMWFEQESHAEFAYNFYKEFGRCCMLLDSVPNNFGEEEYCVASEWKVWDLS
jgi:hypothetical protein